MAGIIVGMTAPTPAQADARQALADLVATLRAWPWLATMATLRQRFQEDRLSLTASSLTFTTLIALVPLATVAFAVFSAFPMFGGFQGALERFFVEALVPDQIAKPVLASLTQFAAKAKKLSPIGLVLLGITALALMLTIDRSLNAIWRVARPRPIAQRVLVYWGALTLGPLLLGISLTATSYALSASQGIVSALPGGLRLLIDLLQFMLMAAAFAGLYHYVPNTHVRWRHALTGGVFVAVGLELAKQGLAAYARSVPSFAAIYGPFATVPIFLVWIYLVWVVVLLGAVVAAYAPSLQMRVVRRPEHAGHEFALAATLLGQLWAAHAGPGRGLSLGELSARLRTDPLQIEPVLDALVELDWVGRLDEDGAQRHVLLCDPTVTPAAPLIDRLLLDPGPATAGFRRHVGIAAMTVSDLIG
jgi:membrane protein